MGILNFFKNAIQVARENQPVKEEHVIHKNIKSPVERRLISDETFRTEQFQKEIIAFALWKYDENSRDYSAAHKCLTEMEGFDLTEKQVNEIIERLKLWNDLKSKKDRFNDLVSKSQTLVNGGQKTKAFELVYEAYIEDHSDIRLVELIARLADMFNTEEYVLELFDKLTVINPDDSYNISYKKALYLKTKKRFDEAIDIFEKSNIERPFAWNYYQIAIIQNLLGNIDICLNNLRTTFELDPRLKQDAKGFPELQNLQQDSRFILLIT